VALTDCVPLVVLCCRSDIMVAALDAYLADKDLEELLDTLQIIAQHAVQAQVWIGRRHTISQ
jgi:hypothetical protein